MRDGAYKSAKGSKYDGYQRGLAIIVYNFFNKKIGWGVGTNGVLAQALHKAVIKQFKRRQSM